MTTKHPDVIWAGVRCEVIDHTKDKLRLAWCGTTLWISRAANLYWADKPSENQPCQECSSSTEHYLSCSQSEQ